MENMDKSNMQPAMPLDGKTIPVYPDRSYIASENYMMRTIAGEHMLICVGDNEKLGNSMINLNETCAFMWQIYQQPLTFSQALEKVKEVYEAPREVLARDVQAFLIQSVQLGLLKEI